MVVLVLCHRIVVGTWHVYFNSVRVILTLTGKTLSSSEMAGKDEGRRVLAMMDEEARDFTAAVLHSSPVDDIDHKRVDLSQTVLDPCSDSSSGNEKKVPSPARCL